METTPIFIFMISITLYTFSKRTNSTKLPDNNTPSRTLNCDIVEDCSIQNPVLIIEGATLTEYMGGFNYAYIPVFNRYYFIEDCTYNAHDGFWHFSLMVDCLASVKSEILNTLQFVERDTVGDLYLADTIYPTVSNPVYTIRRNSSLYDQTYLNGWYIIGVISVGQSQTVGGVTYYFVSASQLQNLVTWLLGLNMFDTTSLAGLSAQLLGMIGEPLQFITSCKFIPFNPSNCYLLDSSVTLASAISNLPDELIRFGMFPSQTGITGKKIPTDFKTVVTYDGSFSLSNNQHPQAPTRGFWLNGNPYTERTIRIEPFGLIPIDCSRLIGYTDLVYRVSIDLFTGQSILTLYASNAPYTTADFTSIPIIAGSSSNCLFDIPLSQFRNEGLLKWGMDNIVLPAQSAGQNFILGGVSGGFTGALSAGAEGLNNQFASFKSGVENFFSPPALSGTPSSLLGRTPIVLTSKFMELVDEDLAELGRPLGKLSSLSTHSGYVKCSGATFNSSSLTSSENDKIETFLNSGFFIE